MRPKHSLALAVFALSAVTPIEAQQVVVNEVAWMGTTASTSDEWIELHNPTGSPVDLTGWTLTAADGTPSINLAGVIPAHGYFLLERTDDNTVPSTPADLIYTGALENGGETLSLRDATQHRRRHHRHLVRGRQQWQGRDGATK